MKSEKAKNSELVGTVINNFEILNYIKREGEKPKFLVRCRKCGNIKELRCDQVKDKRVKSCGCYNKDYRITKRAKEVIGQKKGTIEVIEVAEKGEEKENKFKCMCSECGKITYKTYREIKRIKTCACQYKKISVENAKKGFEKMSEDKSNIYSITRKGTENISRYKGVVWKKDRGKWQAQIEFKGKRYYLGRYEDKEEAIKARKKAEEELYKKYIEEFKELHPELKEKVEEIEKRSSD